MHVSKGRKRTIGMLTSQWVRLPAPCDGFFRQQHFWAPSSSILGAHKPSAEARAEMLLKSCMLLEHKVYSYTGSEYMTSSRTARWRLQDVESRSLPVYLGQVAVGRATGFLEGRAGLRLLQAGRIGAVAVRQTDRHADYSTQTCRFCAHERSIFLSRRGQESNR
jgi:hypothetical protein